MLRGILSGIYGDVEYSVLYASSRAVRDVFELLPLPGVVTPEVVRQRGSYRRPYDGTLNIGEKRIGSC